MDFNLNENKPYCNNDVDLILQQIDILFDTTPRDVLGQPEFGTQYDNYLYNLQISNSGLESEVLADINSLDLFGFTPDVKVYLLQGTEQDIALIEISLSRDDETYKKIYKIS